MGYQEFSSTEVCLQVREIALHLMSPPRLMQNRLSYIGGGWPSTNTTFIAQAVSYWTAEDAQYHCWSSLMRSWMSKTTFPNLNQLRENYSFDNRLQRLHKSSVHLNFWCYLCRTVFADQFVPVPEVIWKGGAVWKHPSENSLLRYRKCLFRQLFQYASVVKVQINHH
jgi:hypothetical protein